MGQLRLSLETFVPGRVFGSWQWSAAAVATVVNNIWACYLPSEREHSPNSSHLLIRLQLKAKHRNREEGKASEEGRQRTGDSDEARVEETESKKEKTAEKKGWRDGRGKETQRG